MTAVPLPARTLVALAVTGVVGLVVFLWPLLLTETTSADLAHVPVILGVVLLLVLVVLLVAVTDGGIDVKAVALLGLLSAVGAVLRPLAAGTAGIETVFLPLVLGGRVLGPGFGFVLGSTTLFASALLSPVVDGSAPGVIDGGGGTRSSRSFSCAISSCVWFTISSRRTRLCSSCVKRWLVCPR